MENVGIIRSIHCTALSNDGMIVEAIKNIFQIYEFDHVLISINTDREYEFELPLSEWLREIVSIIKSGKQGLIQRKMTFSGYDLSVDIQQTHVTLNVRRIENYNEIYAVTVGRSQLKYLVDYMREFLIASYEKYGGDRDELEDMADYTLF
ncbi:hypothetical protein [Sphingomonas bacterium]|uniref:hypothetical protein n=1 Tax=Sphingomonas bacterium TaxID=1895847 RepID=UPI0015752B38|nr:hypothetical protein [Sphingomonas bacterium]